MSTLQVPFGELGSGDAMGDEHPQPSPAPQSFSCFSCLGKLPQAALNGSHSGSAEIQPWQLLGLRFNLGNFGAAALDVPGKGLVSRPSIPPEQNPKSQPRDPKEPLRPEAGGEKQVELSWIVLF